MISKPFIMKTEKVIQQIRPNAAGIDIASRIHYVAVPEDRDELYVRQFGSFTEDLHKIAQWLKKCKIDSIAMESTGIYWIQLYLILEEYGFEVFLVNARHIKSVSGRKSDVLDCQWIQQLHSYGLLSPSFQPDSLIRELRTYMRQRKSLTESCNREVLHIQKAFEQMNIKLHCVISDICGKTGQLMINAILSGERDPYKLIVHVDPNIKASKEEIIKSLHGNWREENVFELRLAYELYLIFKEKINECDLQIEGVLNKLTNENESHPEEIPKRKVYSKNRLGFNATELLFCLLGVDVTKIFGISELLALEIISETGIDMTKWPSKKHFTSWLNLAPNNRISGGKQLKPKKTQKKNKAGQAFLMAAYSLQRSNHWLGIYYRRMKTKSGPLVANKATARKLAIIFYDMVKSKSEFEPIQSEEYQSRFKEQRLKYLQKQAFRLGMSLIPVNNVS